MADYLLDTTAIIDFLRNKGSVAEMLERFSLEGGILGICAVNVIEVYAGMKDGERAATESFLDSLKFYDSDRNVAGIAGELKRNYRKKGVTMSTPDVLIAATAIKNNLVLVTNNSKHFPMKEVRVYSYG